jgi:hypothetical protein
MYETCGKYSGNNKYLCIGLNNLKSWLHSGYGLSMHNYIDDRLKKISNKINYNKQYQEILEILFNMGVGKDDKDKRIHKTKYGYFLPRLKEVYKVVDENGNWVPINKLNTNYSDLAELITELFIRNGESKDIYDYLIKHDINEFKSMLKKRKQDIYKLLDKHFLETEELHDFTKNIIFNSKIGSEAENYVKDVLLKKGFNLIYQGGDGDLIDMLYGIDLVMSWKGTNYLIQVKNSPSVLDGLLKEPKYKWVNLFCSPLNENGENYGIKIIEKKSKTTHFLGEDGKKLTNKKDD